MKKIISIMMTGMIVISLCGCQISLSLPWKEAKEEKDVEATTQVTTESTTEATTEARELEEEILWNDEWEYADHSEIHSSSVVLYRSSKEELKNKTVCVNAGHGTKGGESVYTLCHPDGTAKVTGGSTSRGSVKATSINSGTTLGNGVPEAKQNLKVALTLKEELLNAGYDVLMIRESDDVQLDNIARTVFANNNADYHIAIHYDSTESDKGAFYIGPADVESYRDMEPVASHYQQHEELGESVIHGMEEQGVKIFSSGRMGMDLTQISYSTISSIDLEVGDQESDTSDETVMKIVKGIVAGLDALQ